MMKRIFMLLVVSCMFAGTSHAALSGRGNGLIYDDVLNITWLQNANLAASETFGVSGIGSNGEMNWSTANDWIAAMNTADYLGYSDWRLAKASPVNGTNYVTNSGDYRGSTDHSYNISAPGSTYAGSKASEMAYMFYNNLGNLALYDLNGNYLRPGWGLSNPGPFINIQTNLQTDTYWSGLDYSYGNPSDTYPDYTLNFSFASGGQNLLPKNSNFHAWAVRPGDVTVVPEPVSIILFLTGGATLIGRKYIRRKKIEV
jgi:hypothetical protein